MVRSLGSGALAMNSDETMMLDAGDTRPGQGRWVFAGARFMPSLLVGLAFTAWYLLLYHKDPVRYAMTLGEDGLAEYATAMCYLTAAAVVVCGVLIGRRGGAHRWWSLGIAAVIFAVGMEEISWGQRLFGLETPEALRKLNRQEELTLHNIWSGDIVNSILLIVLTTWLVSSAMMARRAGAKAWAQRNGWPMADLLTAGAFIVVFLIMVWDPHFRFREASEWLLGMSVLAWAVLRVGREMAWPRAAGRKLAVAFMAAGLVAGAATYAAVIKRPAWQGRMVSRIAVKGYINEGRYEQAVTLLTYAMERENYIVPTTYEAKMQALLELGREQEAGRLARDQALVYYENLVAEDPSEDNHRRLTFCRAVAVKTRQGQAASTDGGNAAPPKTVEADLDTDATTATPLSIVGD